MKTGKRTRHALRPERQDVQRTPGVRVCIVLPTYNEAPIIQETLARILKQGVSLPDAELHVLVVDDKSPDGTADLVRAFAKRHARVHLFSREGAHGLGAAYIDGMQRALDTLRPDVIMEMDADGQHDPKYLGSLVEAIRDGADFAIGSRYVPGGSVPKGWGLSRKLLSRIANLYARTLLFTFSVKDCTGGFRAISTKLLKRIDLTALHAKGYVFQVLLLDAALRSNAIVREVPIAFQERVRGESKMRPEEMVKGALLLLRLVSGRHLYSLIAPSPRRTNLPAGALR